MLLEEVEDALGTAEQKVEEVCIGHLREALSNQLSGVSSAQKVEVVETGEEGGC